jgi:hypothetical protein
MPKAMNVDVIVGFLSFLLFDEVFFLLSMTRWIKVFEIAPCNTLFLES